MAGIRASLNGIHVTRSLFRMINIVVRYAIRFHSDELKVIYSAAKPYIQLNATHCGRSKMVFSLGVEKRT